MQLSNIARLLSLSCFAMPGPLSAQPQPGTAFAPVVKGIVLADVERSEFHSRLTENDYNVYVSLPRSYRQGDQRYPVLYVPDMDELFLGVRGASSIMNLAGRVLDEFILVGVPLKSENVADWMRKRTFDLTPTEVQSWNTSFSKQIGGAVHSGGAGLFLRTLKEELIPFIESNYRTAPDRGLAGHSFGGLFAAYVWLNDSGTFSRYLIGSPSLWWDNRVLLKTEAGIADSGKGLRGRVFLSVGADEGGEQVGPFKEFTASLTKHAYPNLRLESHIFEGENHLSGVMATLGRGLKVLYARSQPK